MNRYQKGRAGEDEIADYFEANGYKILDRRFRSGPGEVDIVVKKNDVVVFVEVKTWDAFGEESLEHSVDFLKQKRIKQTALIYLYRHPELGDCRIRFDLVFLSRKRGILNHWDNAF